MDGRRTGVSPPAGPGDDEKLVVVVVSWNTRDLLARCLASLEAHPAPVPTSVWVVDNASEDGSAEMVASEFPAVELVRKRENVGFAAANNLVLERLDELGASHALLLNPDAEVEAGCLARCLEVSRLRPRHVLAARLLNPDGSLQPSCFRFPRLGVDLLEALFLHRLIPAGPRGRILLGGHWDHGAMREVDWALGAFLLAPAEAVRRAGPLSGEYFLFGEDLEWCWRLRRAGHPVLYLPDARAVHHGNQAAGRHPAPWRIVRTHATKYRFLRDTKGPLRAWLHRRVDRLGYRMRAWAYARGDDPARRRVAAEYRAILAALDRAGSDDGVPGGAPTGGSA